MVLLGAAGAVVYRYSTGRRALSQPSVPVPALQFAGRWDVGTVQIRPAGALCASAGLTLVSGIESDAPYLDHERIAKSVDVAGDRP